MTWRVPTRPPGLRRARGADRATGSLAGLAAPYASDESCIGGLAAGSLIGLLVPLTFHPVEQIG